MLKQQVSFHVALCSCCCVLSLLEVVDFFGELFSIIINKKHDEICPKLKLTRNGLFLQLSMLAGTKKAYISI